AQAVLRFTEPLAAGAAATPEHLIITGPVASGKSSLATGLGTEHAFKMGIGRYTTLAKVLEYQERRKRAAAGAVADRPEVRGGHVTDPLHQDFDDGRILWPWDRSPLLILDDVDDLFGYYTGPAAGRMQRAEAIIAALRAEYPEVLDALGRVPRIVWVLTDR